MVQDVGLVNAGGGVRLAADAALVHGDGVRCSFELVIAVQMGVFVLVG